MAAGLRTRTLTSGFGDQYATNYTKPPRMCIEPQYKSNTRRHTRKDSSNSYSEKEVFYGRLHKQKANGAHSRIRTEDLRFTRPLLWPTELSEHINRH